MHVWLRTGKVPLLGLRLYSSGTSESLNSLDSGVGQRTLSRCSLLLLIRFLPLNGSPILQLQKWLTVNYWKWLSVFTQLLPWNFGQRAARCLGISKPLVGGIPSDTCSAYRLCGVATKPPLQTFVFDWQKKIRVCQRLIRRL